MVLHLPVPFHKQEDDVYCLPACVQMVLSYWRKAPSQQKLARQLKVRSGLGAPARNILRLSQRKHTIIHTTGTLTDIENWLNQRIPVIIFLQAGELPHWPNSWSQHAIVVIGMDESHIIALDPAHDEHPITIPTGDFMLAWLEMDYLYAVIHPK